MSDEYYEGIRQAIFWHTMWTGVIPFSIVLGLLVGLVTWFSGKGRRGGE